MREYFSEKLNATIRRTAAKQNDSAEALRDTKKPAGKLRRELAQQAQILSGFIFDSDFIRFS
ncbi:hypothetical protein NQU17_01550 [Clostridiaceae bacterium HFYG-1003]|nr:hypothetical protein NQU17_01550 [Clostridiaceae bacterium HFYG-1003]